MAARAAVMEARKRDLAAQREALRAQVAHAVSLLASVQNEKAEMQVAQERALHVFREQETRMTIQLRDAGAAHARTAEDLQHATAESHVVSAEAEKLDAHKHFLEEKLHNLQVGVRNSRAGIARRADVTLRLTELRAAVYTARVAALELFDAHARDVDTDAERAEVARVEALRARASEAEDAAHTAEKRTSAAEAAMRARVLDSHERARERISAAEMHISAEQESLRVIEMRIPALMRYSKMHRAERKALVAEHRGGGGGGGGAVLERVARAGTKRVRFREPLLALLME